jgi:hypothetical protein
MDQARLERRKIILIGRRYGAPPAALVTVASTRQTYQGTFAFWIPGPQPYKRCSGETRVIDATREEREALRAGIIFEHVQEFDFPNGEPPEWQLQQGMLKIWEALTKQALGFLPSNVPIDHSGKLAMSFTPIIR